MQDNASLVVPFFKNMPMQDMEASKREGRPIFKDMEVVELRIAGDRNFAPTFPAHQMWKRIDGEEITYAQRFSKEYARFADGKEQVASGTPLSELPFLTEAKRAELRGLKIYTAEALASLDGKPLASLGMNGRELKNQAQAYLDRAGSSAETNRMASEIDELRRRVAELSAPSDAAPDLADPDPTDERETLKSAISAITGQRPRGNPSLETLRDMLADLQPSA